MQTIKKIGNMLTKKTNARFRKVVFFVSTIISTGCFIGKIKYAPGTFGSLFAIFLCPFLVKTSMFYQAIFLGFFLVISTLSTHLYLIKIGDKKQDPKEVIIDEIMAIFATAFLCQLITPIMNLQQFLTIFLLFRAFDVIKPYPISYIDKNIHGSIGVMLDDLLASFASFLVYIVIYA